MDRSTLENQTDKLLILVVDDEPSLRHVAEESLLRGGFSVMTAPDAEQALVLFRTLSPDLVLLDICLPGMDGLELCRLLRSEPRNREVPILIMTGTGDLESIDRSYEAGATDFANKPISWPLLLHRLRYLIRTTGLSRELQENQERLVAAERIAGLGWWEWHLTGNRFQVSELARELFGLDQVAFDGSRRSLLSWVYPEDMPKVQTCLAQVLDQGGSVELDHRLKEHCSSVVHHRLTAIVDETGVVTRVFGIILDISARKVAEERIKYLAFYDDLTGLPNRHYFIRQLEMALELARRRQKSLAVLLLGLNNFKKINDTLGHSVGDRLLAECAERFTLQLRKSDQLGLQGETPSRFNGDEFVVLLGEIREAQDALRVARRLTAAMDAPFVVDGQSIVLSVSIGISVFPENGENTELLLQNSDAARNYAKGHATSHIQFYTQSMNEDSRRALALESRMRQALVNQEFVLYYQPKIDLVDGSISGAEALLRWIDPVEGFIMPGDFIPVAERSGLIVPLGDWVLVEACRQSMAWQAAGLPPLKVSVNVSGRQFPEENFVSRVGEIIEQSGIDPRFLDIELTESVLMQDVEKRIENLHDLKKQGVTLSIDDFGTAYSSLNYLVRFPIDYLKVDRSFLVDIPVNRGNVTISSSIIGLAKNLGLKVVAEGVENVDQLAFLQAQGCEECQGFLFSRPLPLVEMTALLQGGQARLPWRHFFPGT
mgnify:FL=1